MALFLVSPATAGASFALSELPAAWINGGRHPLPGDSIPAAQAQSIDKDIPGSPCTRHEPGWCRRISMEEPLYEMLLRDRATQAGLCRFREVVASAATFASTQYTILFVGDSTMRNQYVALCTAMEDLEMFHDPENAFHDAATCTGLLGTTFVVASYVGVTQFEQNLGFIQLKYRLPAPDAIYVGAGLWQLWPDMVAGTLDGGGTLPPAAFDLWPAQRQWANYDAALNATLHAYEALHPRALVVSTVHSPCAAWLPQSAFTTQACVQNLQLRHGADFAHASGARLAAECKAGARGRSGVRALNSRLRAALAAYDAKRRRGHMRLALVDAFKLTDGRCAPV